MCYQQFNVQYDPYENQPRVYFNRCQNQVPVTITLLSSDYSFREEIEAVSRMSLVASKLISI